MHTHTSNSVITATKNGIFTRQRRRKPKFKSYDPVVVEQYEKIRTEQQAAYQNKQSNKSVRMNPVQFALYARLMKGYTKDEMKTYTPYQQKQLKRTFRRAQFVIRKMKIDKYFEYETRLINACFPHAKIGSKLIDYLFKAQLPKHATLSYLKISANDISDVFINEKLLPSDFRKLGIDTLNL